MGKPFGLVLICMIFSFIHTSNHYMFSEMEMCFYFHFYTSFNCTEYKKTNKCISKRQGHVWYIYIPSFFLCMLLLSHILQAEVELKQRRKMFIDISIGNIFNVEIFWNNLSLLKSSRRKLHNITYLVSL
jgi:hypothetical protein